MAVALVLTVGVPVAGYGESLGPTPEDASRRIQPLLGKDMEAKSPILLSDKPQRGSASHPVLGRFRIDSVQDDATSGGIWVHLTFTGGQDGYFLTTPSRLLAYIYNPPFVPNRGAYPTFIDALPAKEAARRRALPGVALGMTEPQALASAWGKPSHTRETQGKYGDRMCWYYPDQNMLCFENNALYTIQK